MGHAALKKGGTLADIGALYLLPEIYSVTPSAQGCEECLKLGDEWVHLRICLICGQVGCCDNSKNKHATKHFHATQHPLIQSFEPGEDWIWCYVDNVALETGQILYEVAP